MIPLMIVSSISFAVSKQFEKHSMDVKHLADKGEVFTSDKDNNILQSIDTSILIETDYKTILETDSPEKIIEIFSTNSQRIIPVLNNDNELVGLIEFEKVRPHLFKPFGLKFFTLKELISQPKELIFLGEKP
jgi:CIC family chloride channel protein